MKKNLKGSALVWAIVTVSMLVIIVGGLLTLSMVYFNKNAETIKDTQAYFNARSGIDFVKTQLEANDYEFRDGFLTKKNDVIYKDGDGETVFTARNSKMSDSGKYLYVTSEGEDNGETVTLTVRFVKTGKGTAEDPEIYVFDGYINEQ